jgi:hypothetical protein
MNIPRQQQEPIDRGVFVKEARQVSQSEKLDEALEESFPASDPVAISITTIYPVMTGSEN